MSTSTVQAEQVVSVGRDRPARSFRILAIDPGPVESAFVQFDGQQVKDAQKVANDWLLPRIGSLAADALVIEQVASFGMPVGAEVFETVFWSGRFAQVWTSTRGGFFRPSNWHRIKRHDIKLHLCHSARANDATIRQALIDRFGGKEAAIGRKAKPGPLYGIKGDCWSALAVAVTWWDQNILEVSHNHKPESST